MMVTNKLLNNNNRLSNIMKNKYCILYVKNYLLKIIEEVAVGNLSRGINYWRRLL